MNNLLLSFYTYLYVNQIAESDVPLRRYPSLEVFTRIIVMTVRIFPVLSFIIGFSTTCFDLDPFLYVFRVFISPDFVLFIIGKLKHGKLSIWVTFRVHDMVHLVAASVRKASDFVVGSELISLTSSAIIGLYLAITTYAFIPIQVYWMFPVVAIGSMSFLQILLIPFIYQHEESMGIIQNLKMALVEVPKVIIGRDFDQRKLVRMRIRVMRTFTFYAGAFDYRFIKLEKSTKISIIDYISGFRISALLAHRN